MEDNRHNESELHGGDYAPESSSMANRRAATDTERQESALQAAPMPRGKKRAAHNSVDAWTARATRSKIHARQPLTTSSADVLAHQQQGQLYDIANAQAEVATATMSAQDCKDSQAESTKKHYRRFQAHWMSWQERKRYTDLRVTYTKFLVYLRELVAEEVVIDPVDDYSSIRPLRVRVKPGYEGDLPSVPMIEAHVTAVVDLYDAQEARAEQTMEAGHSRSKGQSPLRSPEVAAILKKYKLRHYALTKDKDVGRSTIDTGYDKIASLKQFLKVAWVRSYKHQNGGVKTQKIKAARERVSLTWNHYMMTRGQSVRNTLLSHLFPHEYAPRSEGRQFALGIAVQTPPGKTNQDHPVHSAYVRNKDVEVCPVACLAFYFLELWMVPESAPNFRDDDWKSLYLIYGADSTKPMAATTLYRSQRKMMTKTSLGSSKVTHGRREAGSQQAHANGTGIADIAHHGNWNHRRLVTQYLNVVPKQVPYTLAGFTLENEDLWLERNTIIPPIELQMTVFPFIEDLFPGNQDWAMWIRNVMLDQAEEFDRPESGRMDYPDDYIPAMRLMLILAHLRKVVLQDAVVLMGLTDDPLCIYVQHHIFTKMPVFASPLFQEFAVQLRLSIKTARPPLSDSLAAGAPEIQQQFRSVTSSLAGLDSYVRSNLGHIRQRIDIANHSSHLQSITLNKQLLGLNDHMMTLGQEIHDLLKNATQVMGGTVSQMSAEQQQQDREIEQLERQQQEVRQQLLRHQGQRQLQLQQRQDQHHQQRELLPDQPLWLDQGWDPEWNEASDEAGEHELVEGCNQGEDCEQSVQGHEQHGKNHSQVQECHQNQSQPTVPFGYEPSGYEGQLVPHQELPTKIALESLENEIAATKFQVNPDDTPFVMQGRDIDLEGLWEEWFSGDVNGRPSIWSMNKNKKNWRRNWSEQLRATYSFKKIVIFSVLEKIYLTQGMDLDTRITSAIAVVRHAIDVAGSMNQYRLKLKKNTREHNSA